MAQTKPKAAQFYGVTGNGTAGQVLVSDGNGGMSWGSNTEEFTVSWNTPTGQGLTYTQPSPQSSTGAAGTAFPTTTFTVTKSDTILSGTATIANLPAGITATQVITGSGVGNTLTVTLEGVFPTADSLNTDLIISGLTLSKTVSWATPTGQNLVYTQPTPQSSVGFTSATFPTTTFTITSSDSGTTLSGTASISGLPTGITYSQSYNNTNSGNILTITLSGVFPTADSLNTNLVISNLTETSGLSIDYMLLGGGGGGGEGSVKGAGGAGGLYSDTSQLVSTSLTISIGAGGGQSGGTSSTISGDFSATAGGGNGGASSGRGGSSGSGSSGYPSNSGGTQYVVGGNQTYQDGGGGGVGGAGSNGSTSQGVGADGGIGTNDFSTWASATGSGDGGYFGGGGGAMGWWRNTTNTCSIWNCSTGNGGQGGGGNGTAYGVSTVASDCNGAANTGGGGGNFGTGTQPLGGSGICIIKYSGSQAATGGSIYTTGGYTYHKFTSSGTFTRT